MSRDCCVALPRGAMGLSAVCVVAFPDHTHLLFMTLFKVTISDAFISQDVDQYSTIIRYS